MTTSIPQHLIDRPRQLFIVGASVVAGFVMVGIAGRELFVEGIDSKERSSLLKVAAVGFAMWGMGQLIDLDKHWYLTVDGMGKKFEEEMK